MTDGSSGARDRRPPLLERALYQGARAVLVAFARLFWRLRIEGADNIPAHGSFVLAPVHRSNIDFLVVAALTRRRMRYMGKESLWKLKLPGRLFSALGAFPVNRGAADREALRRCIEVIEGGEPLVMFPEGTRREGPVVEEIFDGAAYVASRTGVPIVPVGIGGSAKAMPRGAKLIHPARVRLIVGEPLDPDRPEDGGRVPRRGVRELSNRLRDDLQRLFDEAEERARTP